MLSNTTSIKNGKSLPLQPESQENNKKTILGLGRYIGIVDNSEVTKTMKTETAHYQDQDIITEQPSTFNFDDNKLIDTGNRKSITRKKVSICPPSFRQVHSCVGTCLGFESLRDCIVNYDWMACFHSGWKGKPFKCQGIDIIKLKLDRGDLKLSASDGNIIVEPPPFDYPRLEREKTFDYYMRSGTVNAYLPSNTNAMFDLTVFILGWR